MQYTMETTIPLVHRCKRVWLSYNRLPDYSINRLPSRVLCDQSMTKPLGPTLVGQDVVDDSNHCANCELVRLADRAEDREKERTWRRWRDRKIKKMGLR